MPRPHPAYPYHWSIVAILLIASILPVQLIGQQIASPLYNGRHFTDENGLPQNSVKAIVADKEGFIWLSTESGLVRYDGHRFITYDQSVIPLHSNRMGSFYIAPGAPGNEDHDVFAISNKLDHLQLKHGTVVFNNEGYQKYLAGMPFLREYKEARAFINQSLPNGFKGSLTREICILPDETGGFFVCTPDTVTYYQGLKKKYLLAFHTPDFWSYFRLNKALYWVDDRGRFTEIEAGHASRAMLTGDILHHSAYRQGTRNFEIYWSNVLNQAFLYLDKNLYLLTTGPAGELTTRLILTGFDCATNNIISIYYDQAAQAVYLGSGNKGFFTFSPQPFRTLQVAGNDKDNVFYAQAAWSKDQVLTRQGNILGLTGTAELPLLKQLLDWDKYSLLISRSGDIWTRKGDSIYLLDKGGKKIRNTWDLKGAEPQLYEGASGGLWVGAKGQGLYRFDSTDKGPVLRPFLSNIDFSSIYSLQEEGDKYLWIGSEKGAYRLHLPDGRLDTIKGLEQANIRSIYIPQPGQVWITTYGNGFYLYDNQRLTGFPLDKGGYLSMAHCFVEDSLGYCWIPTNKGLFQAAKKDLLSYAQGKQQTVFYLYHAREEGFNTNEFNGGCQPCAIKLANGYISLPSFNGLVWFSPAHLKTELPDKKIFIDRVEVDQAVLVTRDTLELSRKFKLLKLYASTPYTGSSVNINMAYAWLKAGEDTSWITMGNDMIITQSSLPHGVYALVIRKDNGFGSDNYSYKTLAIIIPPAFYETWWFYGLLLLFVLLLMWLYGRLRLHYIQRKNKQLEALINNRTEELSKVLASLSISEQNIRQQLHVRDILFAAISHDIGSPLKFMSMMAEELRDNLELTDVPDKTKKYADDIFKSGYYMYHLTRNLLQYLRVSDGKSALVYKEFGLRQVIEHKIAIFQPIAHERAVLFNNQVLPSSTLYHDPLLLEVVLHNLIDNAVKVTQRGRITISFRLIDQQPRLVIEDTGPGMPADVVDYYNGDFLANGKQTRMDPVHGGFGLTIVRELVWLTGIKMQIETSEKGTAIHLVFNHTSFFSLPGQ
jgi:signal transduction histidine kinase